MGLELGTILGGAAGLASALFGGDEGSTTTNMIREPVKRDEDQEKIWDDFMDFLYGSAISTNNEGQGGSAAATPGLVDVSQFSTILNDPNFRGTINDLIPAAPTPQSTGIDRTTSGDIPSLLQRITEDTGARATADQSLIDALTGNLGTWQGSREGALSDYEKAVKDSIYGNQVYLDLGNGQRMPWSSGSQRYAQGQLSGLAGDVLGNRNNYVNANLGLENSLARAIRTNAVTHVPNEAYNTYFTAIKDIMNDIENRRYGTVTGTQTQTSDLGLLDTIAGGANVGTSVYDLVQKLTNPINTNNAVNDATTNPWLYAWGQ